MPVFSYTFRDPSGGLQKGTADAESEDVLRRRFEEQGFTITELTMIKAKSPKSKTYGKVKLTNLSVFCRQFSTMVDAGVSLVRCLDVLGHQTQDPKLKKILIDIGERVEAGESLSRAMQRHPRSFNNLFIGLIKAGEIGGVFGRVAPAAFSLLGKGRRTSPQGEIGHDLPGLGRGHGHGHRRFHRLLVHSSVGGDPRRSWFEEG